MNGRTKLGEMLLQEKLITQKQLQTALDFQKGVGGRLGEIIIKLGFLEEPTLMDFLARQAGLPVVNLAELVIPLSLVEKIPRKFIEKHQVVPIAFRDEVLTVAISDPYDFDAIEEIQMALDCKVEMNLATREGIARAIRELFYAEPVQEAPPGGPSISEETPGPPPGEPEETLTPIQQLRALMALLVEKGIISEQELTRKGKELNP